MVRFVICHITIAVLIPLNSLLSHYDGGGSKETGEQFQQQLGTRRLCS